MSTNNTLIRELFLLELHWLHQRDYPDCIRKHLMTCEALTQDAAAQVAGLKQDWIAGVAGKALGQRARSLRESLAHPLL